MKTNELKDRILNDILAPNATVIQLHPDYFSNRYNINRNVFIEIVDAFFGAGLISPAWNDQYCVDWLVEITPKAYQFMALGGFSATSRRKPLKIKNIASFKLCEYRTEPLWVNVWAEIQGGRLKISGQDLGTVVEERFCDIDHEYWYSFDSLNTKRLLSILAGQSHENEVQKIILENLNGLNVFRKVERLCKVYEIVYNYFSY